MGYLNNFKHDVFISYAHVDNGDQWIEKFYNNFKLNLNRRLGRDNSASIWYDSSLRANYVFNDAIKESIENSAVLIAFSSNGFYASDYCIDIELPMFYETALASNIGLAPDKRSRIFQVQLYHKHHSEWASQFAGVNPFKMFKPDPNFPDYLGLTLEEHDDEYGNVMYELVAAVHMLLMHLKTTEKTISAPIQAQQDEPFDVFISKTTDTLHHLKKQLITELQANSISVFDCTWPPPNDKKEHHKLVTSKLKKSKIVLNLFDAYPGIQIAENSCETFNQEQALIAKAMNKEQLIFIPQDLKLEDICDTNHQNFLKAFISEKKIGDNHTLIREFSLPLIVDHIKSKLIVPEPIIADSNILLDFYEADSRYAIDYYNILMQGRQKIYMSSIGNNPSEGLTNYELALKEANAAIIIWCTVAQEWIQERITEIVRAIKTGRSQIRKISIYKGNTLEELNLNELLT